MVLVQITITQKNLTIKKTAESRESVSSHGNNRLQYKVTPTNHTTTKAHIKKGKRLDLLLQNAAVPSDSIQQHRHKSPQQQGT